MFYLESGNAINEARIEWVDGASRIVYMAGGHAETLSVEDWEAMRKLFPTPTKLHAAIKAQASACGNGPIAIPIPIPQIPRIMR